MWTRGVRTGGGSQKCAMNLFYPHGNRVLQSPMHALAAEQGDAEAEERAGLRPWRMGVVGCMAAKAPGRARRKDLNGRDRLASCMATTRRKRKPLGQRRVAQCERFNCFCGKQSRSDVIPDRKPMEVPIAPAAAIPFVPWRSEKIRCRRSRSRAREARKRPGA